MGNLSDCGHYQDWESLQQPHCHFPPGPVCCGLVPVVSNSGSVWNVSHEEMELPPGHLLTADPHPGSVRSFWAWPAYDSWTDL